MRNVPLLLAAALSLAAIACKKKGGGDCTQAIHHSMALSKADMVKMGVDDKMMQKMTDIGVQRCTEDKWSDDALKCMTDAKTMTDSQTCYGKLTQEQQDKMNKAAMALAPSEPPAAGSAVDTGSAAGSAGSAAGSSAQGQ